MNRIISTEKLQALRKGTEGFSLIDVLTKEAFDRDHIPGARNVPVDTLGFPQMVAEKTAGSRTRRVVVYCSGAGSDASARAVKLLVADGFTNVLHYEGGLAAWNENKRAKISRTDRPTH